MNNNIIRNVSGIKEECGIIGICGSPNSVDMAALGLHSLQHRGQESAGIAVSDGTTIHSVKKLGLVSELTLHIRSRIKDFAGSSAIGHTRYSTTGKTNIKNSQPILIDYRMGQLAIAHNGNLTNAMELRRDMEAKGSIFQSTNDSEVFLHLMARSRKKTVVDMAIDALKKVRGAYSLLLLTENMLMAVRDPMGIRPLCLGKKDDSYIVASETCAFDILGAEYIREIEPGELLILEEGMIPRSRHLSKKKGKTAHCVFEYIYFSRPDSRIFGQNVDKVRRGLGRKLAEESPVEADIVIPVPDSSNTAALGYAHASGIPFEIGLIRNHYIGRTFIAPVQEDREARVKIKFNIVRGVLKGKRVIVVEDSIVRGTTLAQLVKLIKRGKPKEIHIRVSSPPVKFPCYFGMDFPTKKELIANRMSVESIRQFLDVDSIAYLSVNGLKECVGDKANNFCMGCFSGKYPGNSKQVTDKRIFEKR